MINIFRRRPKKIALVLGGGSARGLAHIGILKVLERERIPIDIIVGTSMGALVGAAYALGIPLKRIEEYASKYTWQNIFSPTIPTVSVSDGKNLERIIIEVTEGKTFNDVKIPLAIVTTNIQTGKEIIFTKGDLAKLVRASCSWPGIFPPVAVDGVMLVDGGIKNSVPAFVAKTLKADFIIACDVGFYIKQEKLNNVFDYFVQGIQIMGEELNISQSQHADVIIKPDLGKIDQASFNKANEAIPKGEIAANSMIPILKKRLGIK